MTNSIGQKIKSFRDKSDLSQFDLEVLLGASNGSISKIENGQTNPTKETIHNIAKALNLNKSEIAYLLDVGTDSISDSETQDARNAVREMFNNENITALLLNDHWDVAAFSQGFYKLLNANEKDILQMEGVNIVELLFDPNCAFFKKLSPEYLNEMWEFVLSRKLEESRLIGNEPWFQELLQRLSAYDEFNKIWEEMKVNPREILSNKSRTLYFKVDDKVIPMIFSREVLKNHPRFYVVEFTKI